MGMEANALVNPKRRVILFGDGMGKRACSMNYNPG